MMTRYRLRRRRKEESYLRNTKSRFIKTFSSVEEPSVRPHGLFFTWWGCYSVCYVTSGNTRSQSSQFSESLWTDPGVKSGISTREIISTKKIKTQAENELSNILLKSSHARKKPPPPPHFYHRQLSLTNLVQKDSETMRRILLTIWPIITTVTSIYQSKLFKCYW